MANSQPNPVITAIVRPALEPRSHSSPDLHPGKFITQLLPKRLAVRGAHPAPPKHDTPLSSPRSPLVTRPRVETVIMPSTPPSATTAACPAVVVVNPTPHPTPPATPRVPDEPPHPQSSIQPSVSSATLRVPGTLLPMTTHAQSGEHEADGRKAAAAAGASRFFLCQEPATPEHSPSDSSTMGSAANTHSTGPVNAPPRDCTLPPPAPPNSVPTASRSLDETSVMAGSATSSNFRPPSSIGSASRHRKGKEPVRHHVGGNRAGTRPTFAHRHSHNKAHPSPRTQTLPAKPAAPAQAVQYQSSPVQEPRTAAPPPPAAVGPTPGASNKPRTELVTPSPAILPAQTAAVARPASPRVSLFKTLLAPANRKVELATSSEFDSDSADDSSWASEDESVDGERDGQPDIAREAALEVQRQRDMFAKLPTRSWSNLDRIPRTGLLTSLFRPDIAQSGLARHSMSTQDLSAPRTTSAPSLHLNKSAAVAPLTQQVTAQRTGYRPRGRPEGEAVDSDTDSVDPDDTVQLSRSVAQRKLEELVGKGRRRQQQQQQQQPQAGPSFLPAPVSPVAPAAPAPIPFDHARLPPPLPPQTPRTTRRNMLASEMSESLRRNLLWERQVTKRSHGLPRNTSAGSRLQPLTSAAGATQEDEREARRQRAIARNRSWADDFHTSGW